MKIHIGADVDSGAVHSLSVTAADRADISELPNLLRETDQVVFGDAGYASDEYKRGARALGMVWRVQDKSKPKGSLGAALSGSQKKRNRRNSAKATVRRFVDALPPEPQRRRRPAWYDDGCQMLLRDLEGPVVAADVASWALAPRAALPSGADRKAEEAFSNSPSQAAGAR